MQLVRRKAEKQKCKMRIGISGPSGSGKTYSALLLANGLCPDWSRITVVDTEHGSGELYSDLGPYNTIGLKPPFSYEKYIEAIRLCEQSRDAVVILDSCSHVWEGEGGFLELHGKLGGKYQDWAKVNPWYQKFLNAILSSECHIICTTRKKQDHEMVSDGSGKMKVEKIGLKEVIRDGFEYEMTLGFAVNMAHLAATSKDRTSLFDGKPDHVISQETGKKVLEWANSGVEPILEPTQEEDEEFGAVPEELHEDYVKSKPEPPTIEEEQAKAALRIEINKAAQAAGIRTQAEFHKATGFQSTNQANINVLKVILAKLTTKQAS
jgi:hypothetical protein